MPPSDKARAASERRRTTCACFLCLGAIHRSKTECDSYPYECTLDTAIRNEGTGPNPNCTDEGRVTRRRASERRVDDEERLIRTISLASGLIMMIVVLADAVTITTKHQLKNPSYQKRVLISPFLSKSSTQRKMIQRCGLSGDFIVSINVTKQLLIECILRELNREREFVNGGSPYRTTKSRPGRPPQLDSIDILGSD